MSLLPRSHTKFQLKSYWEQFFSKRSTPFEWYGEYTDLCHILHKYIKVVSKTLVAGCGNSKLSEDLYDAGIVDITNIDISEVVIKKMGARNFEKRPKMIFTQMDMLAMDFQDGSFDCVLDKGTLDAIYSNTDDVTVTKVGRMWGEVERVLKVGGRYVCVSLAQQHILDTLLEHFSTGWLLRVHKVVLGEGGEDGRGAGVGGSLPVMVFVLTKMATLPGRPPIQVLEVVGEGGRCERCVGVEGVREFVKAAQQHAMLLHHLKTLHPGEPAVQVQLWGEEVSDLPRYTFSVVDLHKTRTKSGPFALFLVPQGRESEWVFSSDTGMRGLAEQSGYQRLVVVTMHRGHRYGDLQQVREEVSASALTMLQSGVPRSVKFPVLSTGEGVGCRLCLSEGTSSVSGRWSVEECGGEEGGGGEGERVRRLVFLDTPHLVQTEIRLQPNTTKPSQQKKKKRSSKKRPLASSHPSLLPDLSYLTFAYHRAILAALALTRCLSPGGVVKGATGEKEGGRRVLIVGLGGGALPVYIHRHLPHVSVEVCELDPELVGVAENWFGFRQDAGRMTVHVGDGVGFIKNRATTTEMRALYSAIILDVDSKDLSSGMSSPPLTFVEPAFLTATKTLLTEDGVLVTNVAARNQEMRKHVLHTLRQTYPTVVCLPLQEDINEIVVGINKRCETTDVGSSNGVDTLAASQGSLGDDFSNSKQERETVDRSSTVVEEKTIKNGSENFSTANDGYRDCSAAAEEANMQEMLSKNMTAQLNVTLAGATPSSTNVRKSVGGASGDCGWVSGEGVRRRVCDLVRVIGESGGDVEVLETELVQLLASKTVFT